LKAGKYLFRNFNLLKGERKIVKVDNQNVIQMYCDYFTQTREAVWSLVQGLALVKSEE
jgi:phage terminase small subunit